MSIEFIDDVNIYDLGDRLWSGATWTFEQIRKHGKEEALEEYIQDVFYDQTPTITDINDLLWHDSESVFEAVGLDSDGELPIDFENDGEVSTKYLKYLEENFDGEGVTDLFYEVEDVGKEHYSEESFKNTGMYSGTYTTMTISFDNPLDTDDMTSEHCEQYLTALLNTKKVKRVKNDEYLPITHEYKVVTDDDKLYIIVKVLGRILTDDIAELYDFMDDVYNVAESYQVHNDELQ